MLDGIKITYCLPDFETWKSARNISFFTPVNEDTGEVKRRVISPRKWTIYHIGKFGHYNLTVKENHTKELDGKETVKYYLVIDGSLHKNHFGGKNFAPFTWGNIQQEINYLEKRLQLKPELSGVSNLEIGVNLLLPFPVFEFLQSNLIAYKGQPFNRYNPDKNGFCLGFVSQLNQYGVKVYDKGKQFGLPHELMRFELRFLKMQKLNSQGIKHLSDLKEWNKVNGLLPFLLEAWDNVLLYDNTIDLNSPNLTPAQKVLLNNGSNPKYWERLRKRNTRRFNYERKKFKKLVLLHGKNYPGQIREMIKKEWEHLAKNDTSLPHVKEGKLSEFTIKINGKNGQKRFCQSCGKDISHQHPKSKYCSPKYAGEKAAHKCRNNNSNPRNNFKRKVEKINRRGVLFDIMPFFTGRPA